MELNMKYERPNPFRWFFWLMLILIAVILMSCGARKRSVVKEKTYVDIVDNSRLDSIIGSFNRKITVDDNAEFIIEPVFFQSKDTVYTKPKYIYRTRTITKDSVVRDTIYVSKKNDVSIKTTEESRNVDVKRSSSVPTFLLIAAIVAAVIWVLYVIIRKR